MNFKIGDSKIEKMPLDVIRALAIIKKAAAIVHFKKEKLSKPISDAIGNAADEILAGKLDENFPLIVWQTGSGTQTNMNVNEVIANRANEMMGERLGTKSPVHPNDHVNMGQSSNDTFPTAMHISAAIAVHHKLLPALQNMLKEFENCTSKWSAIVKVGRTHLQDATPLTLGQEFSGYAAQIRLAIERIESCIPQVLRLAQGGTAVGTGLNAVANFDAEVCQLISQFTGLPFVPSKNKVIDI